MSLNQKIKNNKETILTTLILAGPLVVLFLGIFLSKIIIDNANATDIENEVNKVSQEIKSSESPFAELNTQAKAIYVKRLNTNEVLFQKNANLALPLASITKLMTVLTADSLLNKSSLVQIREPYLETEGDDGLVVGENLSVENLIKLSLVASSNDASTALASAAGYKISSNETNSLDYFIQRMNSLSKEIGLENSNFKSVTGLDLEDETLPGATGSVKDISNLLEYLLNNNPELIQITKEKKVTIRSNEGIVHNISNTNAIVGQLPNLVASKTGFTKQAGGNLAVVVDPGLNDPIIIVVLGSTFEGRFDDIQSLAKAALESLNYDQ